MWLSHLFFVLGVQHVETVVDENPATMQLLQFRRGAREAGGLSLEPGFVSSLLLLKPQTQHHTNRGGSVRVSVCAPSAETHCLVVFTFLN